MKNAKKAILLVNLGTPDSPSTKDVRRYLDQFLMDGRVIDIPTIRRALLVKGIIAPFRAPQSAKLYKELWDDETGSPLLYYSLVQQQLLQEALGDEYHVELAMRYQNPSIDNALENLRKMMVDSIRVIPLFPHYASASTGSVIDKVMELMRTWRTFPDISIVNQFYDNPLMIKVFAENARKHGLENHDHFLFSYHGLPKRQLDAVDANRTHDCDTHECRHRITEQNKFCYLAQCYATTRLLVAELGIASGDHTVCFQSRLGKTPWIQPYTTDVLKQVAAAGKKRLLMFSPAFVADCLETIVEIGTEYAEEFAELGGEKVQLVESLNDNPQWIEALRLMALNQEPSSKEKEGYGAGRVANIHLHPHDAKANV